MSKPAKSSFCENAVNGLCPVLPLISPSVSLSLQQTPNMLKGRVIIIISEIIRTSQNGSILARETSSVGIRVTDASLDGILQCSDVPFQSLRRPELHHHHQKLTALPTHVRTFPRTHTGNAKSSAKSSHYCYYCD